MDPADVRPDTAPRLAVLGAPWCQWCKVFDAEVLPRADVMNETLTRFRIGHVDVDAAPAWMDLPGIAGLPSVVFFDSEGAHVLTKSGYREAPDFIAMVSAIHAKIIAGTAEPYKRARSSRLTDQALDAEGAAKLLARFEAQTFIKVNSNDGGFGSPSRHPRPKLLVELAQWAEQGSAPLRVREWVDKTVASATRGSSPNLIAEPLPDMSFTNDELVALTRPDAKESPRWRDGIEMLATADPYLGLRDPVDHGYFRYAAGPGWYHPHFERLADENLAWVVLHDELGSKEEARRTMEFITRTFSDERGWLNRAQASDPFYYRLPAERRSAASLPAVVANPDLSTQAWGALADPSRCKQLAATVTADWPRAAFQSNAPEALPDAVGDLMNALVACDQQALAQGVADAAVSRWRGGLPANTRLHRLAAGVCAARHTACAQALAAVADIDVDPAHAPPFVALARQAAE